MRWISLVLLVLGLGVGALGGVDQPESATANAPSGMDSTKVAELQEKYSAQNSDGESGSTAEELSRDFPDQSATPPVVATQDVDRTQEQLQQLGANGREQGSVEGWTLLQVSGADFAELRGELGWALVGGPPGKERGREVPCSVFC